MTRTRTDINQSYKWNSDTLFATDTEWTQAAEQVSTRLDNLQTEDVTTSAETLAETLDGYFELWVAFERVNVYASLRMCIDTTDQRAQEQSGRASSLESQLKTARSTIESEIQQADRERIEDLLAQSEALDRYEQYLRDLLRRAEHTGTMEIEMTLSTLDPATGGNDVYQTLRNTDLSFPDIEHPDGDTRELTLNTHQMLLRSSNRDFRRTVHKHFYDSVAAYRHTIAAIFNQHVETAVRTAELRGDESSLVSALDEENVPVTVYKMLTDTVQENLDPLHDHLQLKRDRLGVKTLQPWDTEVQLVDAAPMIPYDEAKTLLVDAVAPLGKAYQSRLARGLESNWVDVYETQNKTSGAFTIPAYGTQPFVLLNYHKDIDSLLTLAHEMGHAMHADLASETQPMVYGYFDWFVSEIPSTLMQTLLVQHILDTADDALFRNAVLDGWLECFRDLLYRRTRYAVCERRMHDHVANGERLTADRLDQCITEGWKTFNAPVEFDDGRTAGEWMHTGYLIMDKPFYVYQYATGFSAALTLAADIREEWTRNGLSSSPGDTAEHYLRFLRRGSSDYPLDLLADVGVDLTTSEPIERAIDMYRDTLAETVRSTEYM
jgi:oligoendopeptidase F